jgi:hypothetical protein
VDLELPVGDHTVTLTAIDDQGNEAAEATTVTVLPFGYPAVEEVVPNEGSIAGVEPVTIKGSGFKASAQDTIVHFGLSKLTAADIDIIDEFTIKVLSPPTVLGAPVGVSVETPLAESNAKSFTYVAGVPIEFAQGLLSDMNAPAVARFGPDRKLYVGCLDGLMVKLTLDDEYVKIVESVASYVSKYRPM